MGPLATLGQVHYENPLLFIVLDLMNVSIKMKTQLRLNMWATFSATVDCRPFLPFKHAESQTRCAKKLCKPQGGKMLQLEDTHVSNTLENDARLSFRSNDYYMLRIEIMFPSNI
jgi:hypothetical protein